MTMGLKTNYDNEQDVFWIVWNPTGRNPSYRHAVHANAVSEAERLARANPGHEFFVMRADHMVTVGDLRRTAFIEVPF